MIALRDRDGDGLIVTPGGRDSFIGDDVRPNPVVIGCRFGLIEGVMPTFHDHDHGPSSRAGAHVLDRPP